MKCFMVGALAVVMLLTAGCGLSDSAPEVSESLQINEAATDQNTAATGEMTVTSNGIANGYIDPVYGANGDTKDNGIPVLSLPLQINEAPEGTVCYAVYMDDPDAKPLCGYNWVHWLAMNIAQSSIPEDFSRTAQGTVVQGTNDNGTVGYAGPTPPDRDHTYVITVYALDAELTLSEGFSKTEFAEAIQGHVLASATLEGIYKK